MWLFFCGGIAAVSVLMKFDLALVFGILGNWLVQIIGSDSLFAAGYLWVMF